MCSRVGVGTGARVYLWEGIGRGEQNVFRFQVTVNNVFKVQMPQSYKNLATNRKCLKLCFERLVTSYPDEMCTQQAAHLCNEELGEPLGESAFLTGEDHLQHVAMELLHHNKHFLWSLKHALQVHNA